VRKRTNNKTNYPLKKKERKELKIVLSPVCCKWRCWYACVQ